MALKEHGEINSNFIAFWQKSKNRSCNQIGLLSVLSKVTYFQNKWTYLLNEPFRGKILKARKTGASKGEFGNIWTEFEKDLTWTPQRIKAKRQKDFLSLVEIELWCKKSALIVQKHKNRSFQRFFTLFRDTCLNVFDYASWPTSRVRKFLNIIKKTIHFFCLIIISCCCFYL